MRWPNRNPHVLTSGMRKAQKSLATFLPQLDWTSFRRQNLNEEARATGPVRVFACGDDRQAVAWLLRTDTVDRETGRLRSDAPPVAIDLEIPGLATVLTSLPLGQPPRGPAASPFGSSQGTAGSRCCRSRSPPTSRSRCNPSETNRLPLGCAVSLSPEGKLHVPPQGRAVRRGRHPR
jgi:hypothetical protein